MSEVLFSINQNGVATILLNRPKALNSLNFDMVDAIGKQLNRWENDSQVKCVIIRGAGERGLCAGGDIKTLYSAQESEENLEKAYAFFTTEYETDLQVANFPKPIIAYLDGIVMGGGVGLTAGADFRIVSERTTWAMPETSIGFFPDVGGAYFLNQAPGHIGRYLALTGTNLKATDILYTKGATHYLSTERAVDFFQQLEEIEFRDEHVKNDIQNLLEKLQETPTHEAKIEPFQQDIDRHFQYNTVEEIIASLKEDSTDFAKETKKILLTKSPVSLKVTLKQIIDGKNQSLADCLATDLILAKNFMKHPDFFEGVRSVIIDKDQKPNYQYDSLESVSTQFVNGFFQE